MREVDLAKLLRQLPDAKIGECTRKLDDNISRLVTVNYRPMIGKANMWARPKSAKRESNK
jgi:hypothetical protein